MWRWFIGFGNLVSKLLCVYGVWKITIIFLSTTLSVSIWPKTFDCSYEVLSGIFSRIANYVMHKSYKCQKDHTIYTQTEQPISDDEIIILNTINKKISQYVYLILDHYHTLYKIL